MNGGPSHLDTWDKKTGAKAQGPHKPLVTATKGLVVSEHLARTAAHADKLAVAVRGMVRVTVEGQLAVETAQANVLANGLAGRVECLLAEGFGHPLLHDAGPYDLVFANILKQPLIELAPDMARHLAPGGQAILSGILTAQGDEVVAAYDRAGIALVHRDDLGDWTTLVVRKP